MKNQVVKILLFCIILICSCTYNVEPMLFCGVGFQGFPEIPGWNNVEIKSPPVAGSIYDVYFFNESKGLAFASDGFWLTIDAGNTWEKVYSGSALRIKDISFPDSLSGFVAVEFITNSLVRTNDGGHTWSVTDYIPGNQISYLTFIDSLQGYATFNRSTGEYIAKSIDGGITWTELISISASEYRSAGMEILQNGFGYITGDDHDLHLTFDDGLTWKTIQTPADYIYQVQLFNSDLLFIRDRKNIYKTANGGLSWVSISNNSPEIFKFISPDDGIAYVTKSQEFDYDVSINCSGFQTTQNGALTWEDGPVSVGLSLLNVQVLNKNVAMIYTRHTSHNIFKISR